MQPCEDDLKYFSHHVGISGLQGKDDILHNIGTYKYEYIYIYAYIYICR